MGAAQSIDTPYLHTTTRGRLRGLRQCDNTGKTICYRFSRVPYALPPVGNLRWRRPQTLPENFTFNAPSGEPGDYTAFGPICPQPNHLFNFRKAAADGIPSPIEVPFEQGEDCLYLNIWVPPGPAPADGWPVQIHIHGGWLQVGDACQSPYHNPYHLLEASVPRIIVAPAYRLGVLGFLAGKDLAEVREDSVAGNYGLWDQRASIEWCAKYIALFGGNPHNITVGGQSAGANSAFFQLYFDALQPESQRLIQRAYFWSNAVAVQPHPLAAPALTSQFDDLCAAFGISAAAKPTEKLRLLRAVSSEALISSLSRLKLFTFRACTDMSFILPTFLSSLHDGTFSKRMLTNRTEILIAEVAYENRFYSLNNPPQSHQQLLNQLLNFYPEPVVKALLQIYPVPANSNEQNPQVWADLFGQMAADAQVHAAQRGLTHVLLNPPSGVSTTNALPLNNIYRLRIEWRAKCLDRYVHPHLGICHVLDAPIWWASGFGAGFDEEDKRIVLQFIAQFGRWLSREQPSWSPIREESKFSILDANGLLHENVHDPYWEKGLQVWSTIREGQKVAELGRTAGGLHL